MTPSKNRTSFRVESYSFFVDATSERMLDSFVWFVVSWPCTLKRGKKQTCSTSNNEPFESLHWTLISKNILINIFSYKWSATHQIFISSSLRSQRCAWQAWGRIPRALWDGIGRGDRLILWYGLGAPAWASLGMVSPGSGPVLERSRTPTQPVLAGDSLWSHGELFEWKTYTTGYWCK